jgi:hypothetical protein
MKRISKGSTKYSRVNRVEYSIAQYSIVEYSAVQDRKNNLKHYNVEL